MIRLNNIDVLIVEALALKERLLNSPNTDKVQLHAVMEVLSALNKRKVA